MACRQPKFKAGSLTPVSCELSLYKKDINLQEDPLEALYNGLTIGANNLLGYPVSPHIDKDNHAAIIEKFSKFLLLNSGDPYQDGIHSMHNTRFFEREVVNFFGETFKIKNYWGYITSGSSEGNLQGLFIGKNYLKNSFNHTPILLTSLASHYSIKKYANVLDLEVCLLEVNENDEIDLLKFKNILQVISPTIPLLININIGTTMKGGIDDLKNIIEILREEKRDKFYLHADMALYGMVYRFSDDYGDFFSSNIGSLTISGHKFFSIPHSCGVFISRKDTVEISLKQQYVDYICSYDNTMSGTRNGLSSLLWWSSIKGGIEPIKIKIQSCLEHACYLEDKLKEAQIPFIKRPNGIIFSFHKPAERICHKYQLATQKEMAHAICMPHVTRELIDRFVEDLQAIA